MLKRVVLATFIQLLLLTALSMGASSGFQFIITIGIGNVGTTTTLPEYSVLFYTGEANVPVYIDGKEVGRTDALGYLLVRFDKAGSYTAWVGIASWEVTYGRVYFTVEKTPKVIVLQPTANGKLVIFSNVYPVYIYLRDGRLVGIAEGRTSEIVIPQGNYELVFSAPGYEQISQNISVAPREEKPIWLNFTELPLNAEFSVAPEKFSPNGDWFEDETTLKIYTTKPATATLQISDFSGRIVYKKELTLKPGANLITWNGQDVPDGTYDVVISVTDGKSSIERSGKVTIDRSVYTYRKEIAIGTLLAFLGFFAFIIYSSLQSQ